MSPPLDEGPLDVDASKGARTNRTGEVTDTAYDAGYSERVNSAWASGDGVPPDAPATAGAPVAGGIAALPCQNSNNSNKPAKRYRLKRLPNAEGWFTSKDCENAVWEQVDGDTIRRWGKPSAAEAKSAFHLRLNVASFVEHWGRNHCLFFTVTDEANLHPTQFARRWNSFLVRNGSWIVSFIRVLEPQKQGRPHYHLLVAVSFDTNADSFDWTAFDECQIERKETVQPRDFANCARGTKLQQRLSSLRFGRRFERFCLFTD